MAASHRPHLKRFPSGSIAARRVARLLVERLDMWPPIDVQGLLEARAELRRLDWPNQDVDALLTGLGGAGQPPTILMRATDNLLRERFTMAHELGHIELPWHLPAANCYVGEGAFDLSSATSEQEADLFASCLLIPDRWLAQLSGEFGSDMTRMLRELNAAEVTTAAALQALRRYLLSGWVFSAYGGDYVIATAGTRFTEHPSALAAAAKSQGEALLNGYAVKWYRMSEPSSLPTSLDDDLRTDHEILMDAIASIAPDDGSRAVIAQSANGKVGGSLRQAQGRSAAETYEAMVHRLQDWPHRSLLESPDFRLWLAQRSRAIESGRTKRRRASKG